MNYRSVILLLICSVNFHLHAQVYFAKQNNRYELTTSGASHLASLPLKCLQKQFPYKSGITLLDSSFVTSPVNYHPAFYGCFDWHSSVHGHWMLIKLMKDFPNLPEKEKIKQVISVHLSAANIKKELAIFKDDNKSFERIYGWGWLLQLQNELLTWDDVWAREMSANLQPLASHFSKSWIEFLNKLAYPVRVGEHTNLAFGLSLTYDYGVTAKDTLLQNSIVKTALQFYATDKNCPAVYEPGGYDFLSPCLEEADLMSRILNKTEYTSWLKKFLPALFTNPESLYQTAVVKDRSDGKLVHLDGLNFSRSWCLYNIARKLPLVYSAKIKALAFKHLDAALPNVASGDYAGEHWLGSFAVYALSASLK